jgi:ribonucleotide monophosphatase NagD (HAD superfamily)
MLSIGFTDISPEQVYCSCSLAAIFMIKFMPSVSKVYVVGEEGIEEEFQAVGISTIGGSKDRSTVDNKTVDRSIYMDETAVDESILDPQVLKDS